MVYDSTATRNGAKKFAQNPIDIAPSTHHGRRRRPYDRLSIKRQA